MLERHELEAFLTLAEELHFGRTAERLRVSTARVSQTIAKLERRVGVPLFNRTSRRVELSPVGRQLYEEVRPAWSRIGAAFERAIDTGRGFSGTLRVAFVGAAAGQLLVGATELFREREPGCDVQLREAQIAEVFPWLSDGEIDIGLATFPVDQPGIVSGPVLVSEIRMLAVPSQHPFARRTSVSLEDLARVKVLQLPDTLPDSLRDDRTPRTTPAGRPIERGPAAATFNEMLTLIGAGHGVFPVGAQSRRYYARPDVTYIPFSDAPPLRWGLHWRADGATARVRAYSQAAYDLVSGRS
ncbi:LysR family transcriptional regulator [Nonomuraea zeae]|uniref:LysR family transcriptional regulator n=1 Tax=Nonomuraea zeae TaxID=1642303 RepID=A0A5S4GR06_9ACTN|nr:LysR family transcriptional regulator [Nonomuraea zeae]TMR35395.1 LysR family transcriptional regulator [Nonomuraea zeae]